VLEQIAECVVITDLNFEILDVNSAFLQLVGQDRRIITGQVLTNVIRNGEIGNGVPVEGMIGQVRDAIAGKGRTQFTEKLQIQLPNGSGKTVAMTVICLTRMGAAIEGDGSVISSIAFVIDDLTMMKEHEIQILEQTRQVKEMLHRIMPDQIISQLEEGAESISFSVQSSSIGFVQIVPGVNLAEKGDLEAPFRFIHQLYTIFDGQLAKYGQLSKVRDTMDSYVFAGGLFGIVNKPDKHGEEAVRFALGLLGNVMTLEEKLGHPFKLIIGLNTGGPLVAGIISLKQPTFQLIGPPVDLAEQMKATGLPGVIHVTRYVYELVYSHNFNVSERGDTKISGGRSLRTYLIVA
jgi:hypothetical protein